MPARAQRSVRFGALLGTLLAAGGVTGAHAAGACRIQAHGAPPRVVELYTSEGCNSCPPADRWLSTLKGRSDVLAAAFHVDYWDRLGWRDRFASPAYTARQSAIQAAGGSRTIYTPQVVVDGRDWRRWPELPSSVTASPVVLELVRDGDDVAVAVDVRAATGAPARLGLWWAVLEDGHASQVRAGENAGVTLHHDHVVRRHGTHGPWAADQGARLRVATPPLGEGGRPTRLLVVVTDAATGRTVQAAQLAC